MANKKVWKGRFKKDSNEDMEQFSHSIDIDQRLWSDDLKVNLAWAEALREIRIITDQEFVEIRNGLERIRTEFEKGEFRFHPQDEDIHTATERRLTEITPAGAKIHTGRSRNDQVMTDLFLYLKREIDEISILIRDLMEVIVNRAEENIDLIMPGYTHLMPAQPILFAHYLLSLFWFLKRTIDRLGQAQERCNIMPLGSGAISGSGFPIDRKLLANRLCFKHLSQNSLDITSHRDIPIETGSILVMVMVVLSRYSSDLILFSNPNFGLFTIDEAFATGSSMMPQKRNPDSLELIRGQAATTIGRLAGLYTLCHGLPHGYNRDLQEDKKNLFTIIDTVKPSLSIFTGVLKTLKINKERIESALDPTLLATEIANYLTEKGLPFRKAHELTGSIVVWAEENRVRLDEIPLEDLKVFSPLFDNTIYEWLRFDRAIARMAAPGGSGPVPVTRELEQAREAIERTNSGSGLNR